MKVKGNIASFSQLQSPTWPQIILTKDSQFLDFMYHQGILHIIWYLEVIFI